METDVLLVFATFPTRELAREIGRTLVEEKLAACVNLLPAVESIYRWQGTVETAEESLALCKTTAARFSEFEKRLRALHPYEVPEIIAISAKDGLPAYLAWVVESVDQTS
jgi:periplasmic divalent cation tolerance protein